MYTDNNQQTYGEYHREKSLDLGYPTWQACRVKDSAGKIVLSSAYYSECVELVDDVNSQDAEMQVRNGWTELPLTIEPY